MPTDCWPDDNVSMHTCAGTFVLQFIMRKCLREHYIEGKKDNFPSSARSQKYHKTFQIKIELSCGRRPRAE